MLPGIQSDADLSQLPVTDGETITCHLKKRRRIKEQRREGAREYLLNGLREAITPFIICAEHFYICTSPPATQLTCGTQALCFEMQRVGL